MRNAVLFSTMLAALCMSDRASADIVTLDVNGSIGGDILSGTVDFDTSLVGDPYGNPPLSAYPSVDLTLSGPGTDVGVSIAGNYTYGYYWGPAAAPGPYFLNVVQVSASLLPPSAPQLSLLPDFSPTSILGSPFEIRVDVQKGADNDIFGTATFTPTPVDVPEPMTLSLFGGGLAVIGIARRKLCNLGIISATVFPSQFRYEGLVIGKS